MSGSGLENVLRTLAKTFKGSSGQHVGRPQIQAAVVAGAAELDELLDKLGNPDTTPGQKVAAAELIRASIEEDSVSSITEIWYSARGLIAGSQVPECRRAGLRLIISCIVHDERNVGNRIAYYKALVRYANLEDFDLQLEALKTLTKDGRDLLDLYQSGYPLPKVLSGQWLQALAEETRNIRVGKRKDLTLPWGTSTEESFYSLLDFIIKTLKFNIAAYEEADLESLLNEVVNICRTTSNVQDVTMCVDVIDTVMVYGIIPVACLRSILEILCGISVTIDSLKQKAWESVSNLTRSHMGNNTVLNLCRILESAGSHRKEVNSNTLRGAARFLQRLISSPSVRSNENLSIPLHMVLTAYRKSLDIGSLRHALEITRCIYDLITMEETKDLVDYDVWEADSYSPLETLYQISQMDPVQEYAKTLRRSSNGHHGRQGSIAHKQEESSAAKIVDAFSQTLGFLGNSLESKTFNGPDDVVVQFFVDMNLFLDESAALLVVGYFGAMHYCNPMSSSWKENTQTLLNNFFFDMAWPSEIRLKILDIMKAVYILGGNEEQNELVHDIARQIFSMIEICQDEQTVNGLLEFFVFVCQDCSYSLFTLISDILMRQFGSHWPAVGGGLSSSASTAVSLSGGSTLPANHSDKCRLIARSMASLFVKVFRTLPRRARYLYFNLVSICQRMNEPLAFVEAARVLCRIRSTPTNEIYLSEPTNIVSLAEKVGRLIEGDNPTQDQRENCYWLYPDDLPYLEGKLDIPSSTLRRSIPGRELDNGSKHLTQRQYEIDPAMLLNTFSNVLELGADWEIYTFVWVHLPPQLSNLQLFMGCSGEILRLRKVICDQVSTFKLPPLVHIPDTVSKHNIVVLGIYALYMLIAYSDVFAKTDYDYIVQSLLLGLQSWEKTSAACIHALTVCCYECPLSIKKFLSQIFTKFQTKITASATSPYILEFLLSLSRLPWLTDNFTLDEYKRVFGMAFTYIRHANDMSSKSSPADFDRIMSQYLIAVAYSAVSRWFLTIRMADREEMASFITRNLILADGKPDAIDEQSMATLDLISRFTYSNADLVLPKISTENKETKRWLYGKTVISIDKDCSTSETRLVIRRPTGTAVFDLVPDKEMLNGPLTSDLFGPSFFLLQIAPSDAQSINPIRIPNEPQSDRAISAIDRAPVVDFHKISILYIAHGQTQEVDILRNTTGSKAYRRFLSKLGNLVRLKGNTRIYTGGLDTIADADGEFAYAWKDKITQMIFHTATLMPLNPHDVNIASKKRHIGNNFVAIFFDESGLPFQFDTIKSQFNFINIVISPHSTRFNDILDTPGESQGNNKADSDDRSGPGEQADSAASNYFQVKVYSKPGLPQLFAASTLKVVSENSLPVFVRNLAIIASKFATVYYSGGQYVSNWRYRLQQINQLYDRISTQAQQEEANNAADGAGGPRDEEDDTRNFSQDLPLLNALDFTKFS